jgi:hypothetical protein
MSNKISSIKIIIRIGGWQLRVTDGGCDDDDYETDRSVTYVFTNKIAMMDKISAILDDEGTE